MAIKINEKLVNWHVYSTSIDRSHLGNRYLTAELIGDIKGNPQIINSKELFEELETLLAGAPGLPTIKQVIYNEPATIILWNDGTKTVVKCTEGDTYDAEKGFLLAYLKKIHGNDNTFKKLLKQHVPEELEETEEFVINFDGGSFAASVAKLAFDISEKYKNRLGDGQLFPTVLPKITPAAGTKENPQTNDYSSGPFADMYKKFIDVK